MLQLDSILLKFPSPSFKIFNAAHLVGLNHLRFPSLVIALRVKSYSNWWITTGFRKGGSKGMVHSFQIHFKCRQKTAISMTQASLSVILVFFICACLCFISTMRNIEAKNVIIKFILNKEHVLVMLFNITF
jgi:hypothetical protein